jgi:hypothetical protein
MSSVIHIGRTSHIYTWAHLSFLDHCCYLLMNYRTKQYWGLGWGLTLYVRCTFRHSLFPHCEAINIYGPSLFSALPVREIMARWVQHRMWHSDGGSDLPRACSGVDHSSSSYTGSQSPISGWRCLRIWTPGVLVKAAQLGKVFFYDFPKAVLCRIYSSYVPNLVT